MIQAVKSLIIKLDLTAARKAQRTEMTPQLD